MTEKAYVLTLGELEALRASFENPTCDQCSVDVGGCWCGATHSGLGRYSTARLFATIDHLLTRVIPTAEQGRTLLRDGGVDV